MKLTTSITRCKKCPELAASRTHVVIGEGPIPCDLLFLGEAPGKKEDATGKSFQGMSGDILEASAHKVGLTRNVDYHLLNVLKCRIPEHRDPLAIELRNCKPYLDQQLKAVNPKVIIALGKYAQAYVLQLAPHNVTVLSNMGKIIQCSDYYAILSCHPTFVVRNPDAHKALENHIRAARKIIAGRKPKCTALTAR